MKLPLLVLSAAFLFGALLSILLLLDSAPVAQAQSNDLPRNLSGTATSSCSVSLNWTGPAGNPGAVAQYRVQVRPTDSTNDADWEQNQATTNSAQAMINGLTPGTEYAARVRWEGAGYPGNDADRSLFHNAANNFTTPAAHTAADWTGIVPPGLNSGDQYRILFVTCTDFPESDRSNDIAPYNTLVTTAKDGASGTPFAGVEFKVLGSTASVSARSNTGTTGTGGVPIYWHQGDKVADDYADLYDGSWDSTAPRDENGAALTAPSVSTGTSNAGQTSSASPLRLSGSINFGAPSVANHPLWVNQANELNHLYALSQVLTVPTPPTSLVLTVAPDEVNEGAGATEITVTAAFNAGATPPRTATTVTVGLSGLSAGAGVDFANVNDFTFEIPANASSGSGTFTLTPTDDTDEEPDETVSVSALASVGGSQVTGETTLTIIDNEVGVRVSETALSVDEGRTATYTVALSTQPTGNVRIEVSSDNDAITVSPTAFTLNSSNWQQGRTITVRSRDDDRALPVSATLTHTVDDDATTADEYDGATLPSVAVTVNDDEAPVDYDTDDDGIGDGLIEIRTQEQLNAIRYDLNGDGVADNAADEAAYRRAFPRMMAGSCGAAFVAGTSVEVSEDNGPGNCTGYELLNDITLSGSWTPIGGNVPATSDNPYYPGDAVFTGDFDGNGNTISGLRVSRASSYMVGLFGAIGGNQAEVINVCVSGVNVRGQELVGALVGYVLPGATVSRSCSSGAVTGNAVVGGLVGWNQGTIERSYSEASVTGFNLSDSQGPIWSTQLGGLVGGNYGTVVNTYATGAVRGSGHVAGLAGSVWNNGVVRNSYATGAVSSDQGWPHVGGLVGWIYGQGSVAGSYYDTETSSQSKGASQVNPHGIIISYRESGTKLHVITSPGQTTSKLQGTPGARDIYCGWKSEDVNCDGILDVNEDIDHDGRLDDEDEDKDGDGRLDVNEDRNNNGRLDFGEDIDRDGRLDVDEDLDGDENLDVDEDRDNDGKLDRVAEDINNSGSMDSYNVWRFGAATEYPCLVDVTPGCATPTQMNQRASVTVTAADPVAVNEGGSASYTVVLDGQPTGNVVIAMTSDNADVATQPASLTFTTDNWQTAQTVTVSAAQDGDAADDAATISHTVSGADGYAGIAVASVNVAVADDDTAGVTVSESSLSLEEGGSATYTVVLDTQPIADVVIYTLSNVEGVTAVPADLTFTPDNWHKAQEVTVSAAHDDDPADEQGVISHSLGVTAGSAYGSVTIDVVRFSVTDDDADAQPAQQEPENNAPVAAAGSDQTVDAGAAVSLDGSGSSDPDGDALTYAWTQTSGPGVTLAGASSAAPSFTAPSADATLVFSLTVNDGTADGAPDTVAVTVVVPDPQREALEAFYNSTGGGNWTSNANWLSDQPLGEWHGVTVNGQGQVTHLSLRNNGLSGSLPAALGGLEALQVLSLDRNSIGGSLPAQLGNLSNLTRLALNRNQLTGAIPSQLGSLSNLSIIGLARNSLSGSLPSSLGNLTGLTRLSLHDNTALSGALPGGFVNMANLQRLAVANSGICAPDTDAFREWLDTVSDKPGGVPTCQ